MATLTTQIQPSNVQRGPLCLFSTIARVFYEAHKDKALMRFAPTRRMLTTGLRIDLNRLG